jgi:hypothetical protein
VVVMVQDHEAFDQEFIKQHAKVYIDAREHGYDPSSPTAMTS